MCALKLSGICAPAVQAMLATSPALAQRALSWRRSYLHALAIFVQARGAITVEAAKRMIAAEPALADKDTRALLVSGLGDVPRAYERLLDRLRLHFYTLERYREWATLFSDKHFAALAAEIGGGSIAVPSPLSISLAACSTARVTLANTTPI
jgi:hypothetical protein